MGFFKNLFGKGNPEPAAENSVAAPAPARPASLSPGSPAPAKPAAPVGEQIALPLKPIIAKFPAELASTIARKPSASDQVSLPLQAIVEQLSKGQVRISLATVAAGSPSGIFTSEALSAQAQVEIPLGEILSRLKPHQLPKRAAQRTVEVSDDVAAVFGTKGHAPSAPVTPVKPPTPPPAPPSPPPIKPAPVAAPVAVAPPPPPPPPTPMPKPVVEETIKPVSRLPDPASLRPSAPPPPPAPAIPKPVAPTPPAPRVVAPQAAVPSAPIPAASKVPATVRVPLPAVMARWPDAIKQALEGVDFSTTAIDLPGADIEKALRSGRIAMPWKTIRGCIHPAIAAGAAAGEDDTELELPLPAIVPLFMAAFKPAAPARNIEAPQNINDLFMPRAAVPAMVPAVEEPAPPTAATPPAPPPVPIPVFAPIPAPSLPAQSPTQKPKPTVGEVFGQPGRTDWSLTDVVQKTSEIPGIAGAVLAMEDGLLIAGQLGPGLDSEAVAGFLPQTFDKLIPFLKILNIAEPDTLTFVVDEAPLQVRRAGSFYFAIIGTPGRALPADSLATIAAYLAAESRK